MKNTVLVASLIALLLSTGCIGQIDDAISQIPFLNSTPSGVPSETPTTGIPRIPGQDPIIGTWYWTLFDQTKTIFYTFTPDGRYSTRDSLNEGTENGTWIKYGENQYNVTIEGRQKILYVYQPATNTITMADNPGIQFYPESQYLGKRSITPNVPAPSCKIGNPLISSSSSNVEIQSLQGIWVDNALSIQGKLKSSSSDTLYTTVSGIACNSLTAKCGSSTAVVIIEPNEIEDFSMSITDGCSAHESCQCEARIDYVTK